MEKEDYLEVLLLLKSWWEIKKKNYTYYSKEELHKILFDNILCNSKIQGKIKE